MFGAVLSKYQNISAGGLQCLLALVLQSVNSPKLIERTQVKNDASSHWALGRIRLWVTPSTSTILLNTVMNQFLHLLIYLTVQCLRELIPLPKRSYL